jgi:hypothetical protein
MGAAQHDAEAQPVGDRERIDILDQSIEDQIDGLDCAVGLLRERKAAPGEIIFSLPQRILTQIRQHKRIHADKRGDDEEGAENKRDEWA